LAGVVRIKYLNHFRHQIYALCFGALIELEEVFTMPARLQ
jgi:hypothetical protein